MINTTEQNKKSTLTTKTRLQMSAAMLLAATTSLSVYAAVENSDAFAPGDSNSKWVVGGSIGTITNPFQGEDTLGYITPNIEYRGENFFIKDSEIGYTLYRDSGFSFGAVLTGSEWFLTDDDDYDDNAKLVGLKERDATLDMGVYFMHSTELGRLKITLLDEITGEHGGQTADVNYTFDLEYADWNINPVLGAGWMSSDTVDHFFGVSNSEANVNRAAYKGDSALTVYTGVRGRYELTENWDVNLGVAYVRLGSGITDSSIVEDKSMFVTNVGVNYNF